MHAAAIADALEIRRVVCPSACGVLSAWGISVAGPRRDRSRSIVRALDQLSPEDLQAVEGELAEGAAAELAIPRQRLTTDTTYELRYAGQAFELPVNAPRDQLAEAFHLAHERRFGFADRDGAVELVTVRVSITTESDGDDGAPVPADGAVTVSRDAWFDGEFLEASVLRGAPPAGSPVDGPALIQQEQATVVVPPGWTASTTGGDIVLDRRAANGTP
jgi:N-methylhydantoinase A